MNMCEYCYKRGMTIEEYKQFEENIKSTAKAIRSQLSYNGGLYYNTNNLFNNSYDEIVKCFIIDELKLLGIEFFKNNTEYRVVD